MIRRDSREIGAGAKKGEISPFLVFLIRLLLRTNTLKANKLKPVSAMNRHKLIFQAVAVLLYILVNSLSLIQAQKLTFDRMAKYERSYGDRTYVSSAYAISTDDHYFLDIYRNRAEETKVYLFDFRQGKRHDYIVDVKIVGGNDVYNFRYIKSVKISTSPKRGEYYDFQSVTTDGGYRNGKVDFL